MFFWVFPTFSGFLHFRRFCSIIDILDDFGSKWTKMDSFDECWPKWTDSQRASAHILCELTPPAARGLLVIVLQLPLCYILCKKWQMTEKKTYVSAATAQASCAVITGTLNQRKKSCKKCRLRDHLQLLIYFVVSYIPPTENLEYFLNKINL